MSEKLERLPLFPLDSVLFPYAPLQLHVFEDRYRDMVRQCIAEDSPFGVVLIRTGSEVGGPAEPYMVGTAVRIVQVHTYEDGRLDVQVRGERRFRIRRLDDSQPCLVGYVEPVVELDLDDSPAAQQLIAQTRQDFENYVQGLFARQEYRVQVRFPPDPLALSFAIANHLQMENLEKQRLLELTDTIERLQGLVPILERNILEAHTPNWRRLRPSDLVEWIHAN
jgi:uncharacterized protein